MAVLGVYNLSIGFSGKELFSGISFDVGERDRVGLVGVNSAGKTTLFKLITGALTADGGEIVLRRGAVVGYMEQHACEGSTRTLYDEIVSVFEPLSEMEREIESISAQLESLGASDELIARQTALREEFERKDGLTYRSRARSALLGLGFPESEHCMTVNKLSGGQRSKLALGKLLLSGAELILLDEPTNHLDIDSVEWLEGFLRDYRGAAVIISHDRYFLDRVTTRTMELSQGKLTCFAGSYSKYLDERKKQDELDRRHYDNQVSEIRHIEEIIEQQRRWGRERNFITAESKQKMLDKKRSELLVLRRPEQEIRFSFPAPPMGGNEVVRCHSLSKSYDGRKLFSNASFTVTRGERVFILGPNGCGKTTLLRLLLHREPPDSGLISPGINIKTGYFEQGLAGLSSEKTVLDEVWDGHRTLDATQIRSALAAFLFKGETVYSRMCVLSGGERARIALLKLMLSGCNFLLLDEPTNHLDIASREALEKALSEFEGTILAVSHDRYFINKLSTRILYLSESGIEECTGGYDDYLEKKQGAQRAAVAVKPKQNDYKQRRERESERRRLEGRLKRCEAAIEEIDTELSRISAELENPETAADYERVLALSEEAAELSARQEKLMEEWEQLANDNAMEEE